VVLKTFTPSRRKTKFEKRKSNLKWKSIFEVKTKLKWENKKSEVGKNNLKWEKQI
jgi:hypothetical protein